MNFDRIIKMVSLRYGAQKSTEDREDYEQECRMALFKNEGMFLELTDLAASKLAYIICRNAVLDYIRKESTEEDIPDWEIKYEPDLDTGLDCQAAARFLDELPEPHREILKRRFGMLGPPQSLRDVAEEMGLPAMSVSRKEKEALKMLRKRMKC